MATTTFLASGYTLSNTSYLSISNAANMYTNTSSTTYATINHKRAATTAYYVYVSGFNFPTLPEGATIQSAILSVKAMVSGASAVTPALYNGTTSLSKSLSGTIGTSAVTRTVDITSNYNTYKGYGNNFRVRFSLNRSNKNTASYLRIYGAQIEITYTEPVTKNTVTINVISTESLMSGFNIVARSMVDSEEFFEFTPNLGYQKFSSTFEISKTTKVQLTFSISEYKQEQISISSITNDSVNPALVFDVEDQQTHISYNSYFDTIDNMIINIYITFDHTNNSDVYIKQNGSWVQSVKVFVKQEDSWVEITKDDIDTSAIYLLV